MSTKKSPIASAHSKKEYKKEVYTKLETALQELKSTVGEKEFQHRLKKAAKVLVHGLHSKDFSTNNNGVAKPGNTAAKKIKGLKKVSAKKASAKKAATKKAKESKPGETATTEN